MSKLLAIDTSTHQGSLTFFEVDEYGATNIVYDHSWGGVLSGQRAGHSEYLASAVDKALFELGWSLKELEGFFVTSGPGSFTGLRVGLNMVKTWAYVLDRPIYTLNSLENLALSVVSEKQDHPILCLLNAFKNMVYLASFRWQEGELVPFLSPQAVLVKDLESLIQEPHLCLGDGYGVYESVFDQELKSRLLRSSSYSDCPHSRNFQFRGVQGCQQESWKTASPLYLRPSSAEEKLKDGSLKPVFLRR